MILMRYRPHSYGACLALILSLSGCENPGEQLTAHQNSQTEYPITRTITDNTGRPLEATIIGRDSGSITVIRKSDGSRFNIPYDKLSEADRSFVVKLPLQSAKSSTPIAGTGSTASNDGERGILGFRRIKLQEIDDQIRKNESIIYQIGPNTMKGRSLRSEVDRLIRERAELAAEITELEAR